MKYKTASEDVVFEDFDGETVVLDLGTGRYFGLNAAASALWPTLSSGVDSAALARAGVDPSWVSRFARDCIEAGLLVEAPETPERRLPVGFQVPVDAPPQIEVHSELSDLIAADPIHDVDLEVGWPHLPPDQGNR